MVYCGKPSKGCAECRKRKTRCDAKPEGCTQCAKARRVCPGYRSEIDVIFRDQSANVIQKARANEAKKAKAGFFAGSAASPAPVAPERSEFEDEMAVDDFEPEVEELPVSRFLVDSGFTIVPTLEERATCHFVSQYVVGIQAPSRGLMDNLAFMYKYCDFDDTLTTAVKAISYASFAHHSRSSELDDASRYQYTKAIGLTNSALRAPDQAVKDTTLLSILLLSMYEVITGTNHRSIQAWMEHVRGSAALLKLRGPAQLSTPIGRRLFVQANTGILITSVQLNIPVPQDIIDMTRSLPDMIPASDDFAQRAYKIHQTMLDFNQYRAAATSGKINNPHVVVARALELDKRLADIYEVPTPEWQYQIIRTNNVDDNDIVYNGLYHVYSDLLTANLWNAVRVMRGLLHEDLRKTLLKGFSARPPDFSLPEHTAQFQRSTDFCYEVQAEILATVPQHLGYVQQSGPTRSSNMWYESPSKTAGILSDQHRDPQLPPEMIQHAEYSENRNAPASGGLNLMWPLFFAGTMDLSGPEVRQYAVCNLRRIGKDMGIKQAFVLAKVAEMKADLGLGHGSRVTTEDDAEDVTMDEAIRDAEESVR